MMDVVARFASKLPRLTSAAYKGNMGRVAVIGGCAAYTGAPYFAAMSALRCGADLAYVITSEQAAPIIKGYHPDLIVLPILNESKIDEIFSWLERANSIVLGPGLGRDWSSDFIFTKLIRCSTTSTHSKKTFVIDADALFYLQNDLSEPLSSNVILTPNLNEARRFVGGGEVSDDSMRALADRMRCNVLLKGQQDALFSANGDVHRGIEEGCLRRCGGQGDLLAGAVATFNFYAPSDPDATLAASALIRLSALHTFKQFGRSMLTNDILANLHLVFGKMFD